MNVSLNNYIHEWVNCMLSGEFFTQKLDLGILWQQLHKSNKSVALLRMLWFVGEQFSCKEQTHFLHTRENYICTCIAWILFREIIGI